MWPNLNRPTRRGREPRAGQEVPILAKRRGVGAAQVPARTHSAPTLASSPNANTLKECKRTSKRKANQERRHRGFPGKLSKNANFLWTGLPYGPLVKLGSGPKIQISPNISRRKAKTSSVCIQIKLWKNDTLSQLIDVTNRTFHTPG